MLKIHERDNVAVCLGGELNGHKVALCDIKKGANVIKYGYPIGHATKDITKGEHVHTHNLKTNLSGVLDYSYEPQLKKKAAAGEPVFFNGYRRADGSVGIRNEVWIINTVGCVNKTAELLAKEGKRLFGDRMDGIFAFPHPHGCSQLGEDHANTQRILRGLVRHPNAAGVLVLGLGCENNNIDEFKKILGDTDAKRVRFLSIQDSGDEIRQGIALLDKLTVYAQGFKREQIPASELVVGLKCGGSDAFSGLTANPLTGAFSDMLISSGGSAVLTEVPEMFGAETILMNRAVSRPVFDDTVQLINNFKEYFLRYNQVVYENPSPGNKAGGITTLEEKSLGCVQKGGTANVECAVKPGERITTRGLNLLDGPGNDIVAITNLAAAGCHLILFTTGRGTPVGAPVPTIKISSNTALAQSKPHWIDFDAGPMLEGASRAEEFFEYTLSVASGKKTNSEKQGYREIAIFKDGVTL